MGWDRSGDYRFDCCRNHWRDVASMEGFARFCTSCAWNTSECCIRQRYLDCGCVRFGMHCNSTFAAHNLRSRVAFLGICFGRASVIAHCVFRALGSNSVDRRSNTFSMVGKFSTHSQRTLIRVTCRKSVEIWTCRWCIDGWRLGAREHLDKWQCDTE